MSAVRVSIESAEQNSSVFISFEGIVPQSFAATHLLPCHYNIELKEIITIGERMI